jgi:hypothetical protein
MTTIKVFRERFEGGGGGGGEAIATNVLNILFFIFILVLIGIDLWINLSANLKQTRLWLPACKHCVVNSLVIKLRK